MAETTREALGAHLKRWRSKGQPGFNANPIDELVESVRFLCDRADGQRPPEGRKARKRGAQQSLDLGESG